MQQTSTETPRPFATTAPAGSRARRAVLLAAAVACVDAAPAAPGDARAGLCGCADAQCLGAAAASAGGAGGNAVPFVGGEATLPGLSVTTASPALRLFVAVRAGLQRMRAILRAS